MHNLGSPEGACTFMTRHLSIGIAKVVAQANVFDCV